MSAAAVPLEQQAREVWRAARQLRHGNAGISVGIAVKALRTAARAQSDRLRRVAEEALRCAGRTCPAALVAVLDREAEEACDD
ncbi:MAG: hypothetical protein GEU92_12305 [Alphaproteobacteria bacterium]|nr:hypothetical protein [Alphaproteobacteria bacterium]